MIVLDTHVWLWWVKQDARCGDGWLNEIRGANAVGVSAMSLYEVGWLHKSSRIELPVPLTEWFNLALDGSRVTLLPLSIEVCSLAVSLPSHHNDPQDRIIIATAIAHDAKLLSVDNKFKLYRELDGLLVGV
jgi:PIN domain nuclease of toxin-antitoxin system